MTADAVQLRLSQDPDGALITLTPGEWRAFVAGVRSGEVEPL